MEKPSRAETLISNLGQASDETDLEDEEQLEQLAADVNQLARKLLENRSKLPDQLKDALASRLAALRPLVPPHPSDGSDPEPSGNPNPDAGGPVESRKRPQVAEEDQEIADKTQLLRQKISNTVSALPVLLERVKQCMSKIDNLESSSEFIHPAFKRKRTS